MNQEIYIQALKAIQSIYGEDAVFREGQYEAIEATLTHHRTLVVQKTGWGKSLVYFVCTQIQRKLGKGLTIVVSPLLVLMENQLQAANKLGLHCAVLNSKTKDKRNEHLSEMKAGTLDLVLITPETLFTDEIQSALSQVKIGLFVIDEVHCISDWGHDFRLEYTRLNRVIKRIPQIVPVLGTTATANERVIEDLKKQFGDSVYVSRGELMRRSLSIQILHLSTSAERYAWILQNISNLPGSGIIYCLTQRDCEQLAYFLKDNGIYAQAYHSGMSQQDTNQAEHMLQNNQIKVLVSTIKLGMGYDKEDISFVIHYQQPSNVVAYYQQIGRAGRNIDRAYTFLMCGNEDKAIQDYFIETAFPSETEAKDIYNVIFNHSDCGITAKKIEGYVNIRKNRVDKALMFLCNEEIIWKDENKYYYPTPHKFHYNREHYEQIKAIRYREQKQMQEITKTNMCISRFVVNCLDDQTAENCGICRNCLGYDEYPAVPDEMFIKTAQMYLEQLQIPIEPRKQWPDKEEFTGSAKIAVPNETGICLSKYGDSGYGMLVKIGKYRTSLGFCTELIEKSAEVLRPIIAEKQINAITCVPSLRSRIVVNFAEQLAERCGLPFISILNKKGYNKQQKDMENSIYQCRNAWNSFSLLPNIANIPKRVILVDDIVDSKWTMTVCGYLLTQAGCEMVFPFALADSSENRRKQN
ncbi:MAG: RecQ family ATP-dependent DNA helicase [Oscillospiraceae bacterium]|nr:RecQ family ATP-dependent DNA helicase [Oscillospiraceae bacterium]